MGPDGKPMMPPMGPDGKPMMPPMGPDGKPVQPMGPDGKPMMPPMGPDGKPMAGPMMMGPNGPVPMPPPNHPIMMEMQALDQHMRALSQQPPTPENQQKVCSNNIAHKIHILSCTILDERDAGANEAFTTESRTSNWARW